MISWQRLDAESCEGEDFEIVQSGPGWSDVDAMLVSGNDGNDGTDMDIPDARRHDLEREQEIGGEKDSEFSLYVNYLLYTVYTKSTFGFSSFSAK